MSTTTAVTLRPTALAGLRDFLTRLLRYDRAAVVRLRDDGAAVAVVGRPPLDVLAVRAVPLAEPPAEPIDRTVSAGDLLHADADPAIRLPAEVTGPPWAGRLPPRGDWRRLAEPSSAELASRLAEAITEFRSRTEAPQGERGRRELDALADEIWSRRPLPDTVPDLTLRLVHASRAMGFLPPTQDAPPAVVLRNGPWLRLSTPAGSILRRPATTGLALSPR